VFTTCPDERRRAQFIEELVAGTHSVEGTTLVLLAVRADFYGRCGAYPDLSAALGAGHVLLGPMTRDELRQAIELPAERVGLRLEPGLVERLLADCEGESGALPLLSTALAELWRERDGRHLRLAGYERTAGVRGAVARLAEEAYGRLDPAALTQPAHLRPELAPDGVAAQLAFLLPRTPTTTPQQAALTGLPGDPVAGGVPAVRLVRPAAGAGGAP